MYITIFVFFSPGSCFNSVIYIQNLLGSAPQDKQVKKNPGNIDPRLLSSARPRSTQPHFHRRDDDKFHKISTQSVIGSVLRTQLCLKQSGQATVEIRSNDLKSR